MTAFRESTKKDVDDLSGILKIANLDNYRDTLPQFRGALAAHKRKLSRAMIQTPPVLTVKNRDKFLTKWRQIEQCLVMTVSRDMKNYNDWYFIMTQSKEIVEADE